MLILLSHWFTVFGLLHVVVSEGKEMVAIPASWVRVQPFRSVVK